MTDHNIVRNSNNKISSLELLEQHIEEIFEILTNLEEDHHSSEFQFNFSCNSDAMNSLIEIEQLIVEYIWLDKKIDMESKLGSEREIKKAIENIEAVNNRKYTYSRNSLFLCETKENNDAFSEDQYKKFQDHICRATGSYLTFLELRGNAYIQLGESLTRRFEGGYINVFTNNNPLDKSEAVQVLKGAKINLTDGQDFLKELFNILNRYNQSKLRDEIIEGKQLEKIALLSEFNVRHTFSRILYVDERLNSFKDCTKSKARIHSKSIRNGNKTYIVRFFEAHCNLFKVILGLLSQLTVVTIFLNKNRFWENASQKKTNDESNP